MRRGVGRVRVKHWPGVIVVAAVSTTNVNRFSLIGISYTVRPVTNRHLRRGHCASRVTARKREDYHSHNEQGHRN
jgi:hypothetical protein